MRPKHQITLPANVVRAAKHEVDDRLQVEFINGVIIKPQRAAPPKLDALAFAGIGASLWGTTTEEIDQSIRGSRGSWER